MRPVEERAANGALSEGAHRRVGVEEEFHLVDLRTSRLTTRAPELLELLPADGPFVEELQRCVIESNSGVHQRLSDLRDNLRSQRSVLVEAARSLGIGVVAAGSVPLSVPTEMRVTETPRYRRMLADYQLLAREQLICGTQVHVDVTDRDEAVAVAARLTPYVPALLALSASSPFWADGTDTGYASSRTLIWQRWPTSGPFPDLHSAADYDAEIDRLISSGVISDPGMLYFDVRPSARLRTLELRVCDSCPSVDTITVIAGLFRALVVREARRLDEPAAPTSPPLYRAALWQAARAGLEGDLIDVEHATPRPASSVITALTEMVRPELEANGDWAAVSELTRQALSSGSSSSRQRRILRRRGRLTAVVDHLIAETAGTLPTVTVPADPEGRMLHGYHRIETTDDVPVVDAPDRLSYDEAVADDVTARPGYAEILSVAAGLGAAELRKRQYQIEREQSIDGVTFRVTGQSRAQLFPLDIVPRYIGADDWVRVGAGLRQRALALNAFIIDVYGEQEAVHDGIIPPEALDRAPGFRQTGRVPAWQRVRTHICGTDLVSAAPGRFMVLEDNLRVPSGIAYAMSNRELLSQFVPEIPMPSDTLPLNDVPRMLGETIAAAGPPDPHPDGIDIMLSSGWQDSAWFEHTLLARGAGLAVATPENISVTVGDGPDAGRVHFHHGTARVPVNTAYVRMDEDMLLSSKGFDRAPLRPGILDGLARGRFAIANALGNGVGDDKAIYYYVPNMIRYYLGEEPLLDQVPTWLCAERHQRDHVLANLEHLVVKPIDGLGGSDITIGPECDEEELARRRVDLLTHPERYIAQEVVALSTHPTFDGNGFYAHHVDLRAFVHLRDSGEHVTAHVAPAALTRVAPAGSLIVNSSRGGGGKDTWIQGVPEGPGAAGSSAPG
ncbi:carboxylate--amine ligase/circularly permuted type 2 ATP-grasp protein [Gordonia sp. ABSL11-1]|uniref:carboxylate--amine ligase/circularly permuted type 2 ATP-grasp protein n=1 Tax=Gordonia sp. ABSL11-1 TaxID=3053924 RepID=UPI0025727E77|nr:carboxylate--amine ligase/circularly permuted type 2 ATP-grasp protein [Gordonia sp. ABSL11-1]MDL9944876.1 carboxylate--amine ligase/circularly permuted type 2 ATP-grasp protein [Gordonia sp. ABSL11-1]